MEINMYEIYTTPLEIYFFSACVEAIESYTKSWLPMWIWSKEPPIAELDHSLNEARDWGLGVLLKLLVGSCGISPGRMGTGATFR